MEQQREQSKEFLDDLITRDQRMFLAVLTMVHTAETKEQLDSDGANPVILKSEFILSLCEQLIGSGNLGAKQKSIIDRCTAQVYRFLYFY